MEQRDFWGGDKMLSNASKCTEVRAITQADIYKITDVDIMKNIPIIRWKMMEQNEKRK